VSPEILRLISAWRQGSGPLQRRLANSLRESIERGDLAPGTRLPPERILAARLGLSRTTVVGAFNSLREEGWLVSRRGSGSFVSTPRGDNGQRDQLVAQLARNPLFSGLVESPTATINFRAAAPEAATAVSVAAQLAVPDLAAHLGGPGYSTAGLLALRQALAAHLSRWAVPTSEDQIIVTTGGQQAISLLAALYVERGDPVVVERPTYPGALDAFRTSGARLLGVAVGDQGVQPDRLREVLIRSRARIVYLTPSFNNPTSASISLNARRELARVAEEFQATLIEDHTLAETSLDGSPPQRPIASFAGPEGAIIMVGSLSKLYWAALRVGWIRAPKSVIARLARLKAVADVASSVLPQLVAVRLLPMFEEVKAERQQQFAARLDHLTSLLEEQLPSWSWKRPPGGVSLWVRLPQGDASEFAEFAFRHGVAVVAGPHFCPDDGYQDYLRIAYCRETGSRLESGVHRLALAWDAYAPISEQTRANVHRPIV
jgi:DNA-binding transcriptional MocR family regulator